MAQKDLRSEGTPLGRAVGAAISDYISRGNDIAAHIPEHKQHMKFCKFATDRVRDWAWQESMFIRYTVKVPVLAAHANARKYNYMLNHSQLLNSRKPVATSMALFDPHGGLYVGGAVCSPRDTWTKQVGRWNAIWSMSPIGTHAAERMVREYQRTPYVCAARAQDGKECISPQYALDANNNNSKADSAIAALGAHWQFFYQFPARAREGIISCMETALWFQERIKAKGLAQLEEGDVVASRVNASMR